MSANDKEALDMMASDWAKDHDALTARVAELEAEVESLRKENKSLIDQAGDAIACCEAAEAEVEKQRELLEMLAEVEKRAEASFKAFDMAETKLAEVEKERDEWKELAKEELAKLKDTARLLSGKAE